MADSETHFSGLPVPLEARQPRPSLLRNQTRADFVSQLLAGREKLPPQRERRRGSSEGAIGAYSAGAKVAIKRMPLGYRTTIVA
ncbi:MAG: hypothetical protein P0Y65_20210 [Candidatus Devosia phytovorans]|uniref:Uncharacterized protein n=1 Tax=Candidatus Devosia phytovorans TaxID=3121372 RepID=A0AAJ5VTE5_9HYPH|nr:hypothetical protein [Devosia sp.]WEK04469.1 MAG: hypothetical protein P0Y65_20210 [Devosia sp.]